MPRILLQLQPRHLKAGLFFDRHEAAALIRGRTGWIETPMRPTSDEGAGGLIRGLGGPLDKLQKGGRGQVGNSWVGSPRPKPPSVRDQWRV